MEERKPTSYANRAYRISNINCIDLWFNKLEHKNYDSITEIMSKLVALGININNCKHNKIYEICIKSKLTDMLYPKLAQHRGTKILELIYSDMLGPKQTSSISEKTIPNIHRYSRFTMIYLWCTKTEVITKLKEYTIIVNNNFGRKTESSDHGGEYT